MNHELKIESIYFEEVYNGNKKFEIRKNDRNFKINDIIHLREIRNKKYTGSNIVALITYITDYEQKEGYIVMSIKIISKVKIL